MKDKFVNFAKSVWEYIKAAKIELIVLFAALALDLVSKALVVHFLEDYGSVTIIPNFLKFTYLRNYNAAFGSAFGLDELFGQTGVRITFIVITLIAVGFFGYFMVKSKGGNIINRLAFALIIGGALGNLYDRIFIGYVRDFVEFVYFGLTIFGSKSFAVFNIADAALCIGVALFIVYYLFIYKEPTKEQLPEPVATDTAQEEIATEEKVEEKNGTDLQDR